MRIMAGKVWASPGDADAAVDVGTGEAPMRTPPPTGSKVISIPIHFFLICR